MRAEDQKQEYKLEGPNIAKDNFKYASLILRSPSDLQMHSGHY